MGLLFWNQIRFGLCMFVRPAHQQAQTIKNSGNESPCSKLNVSVLIFYGDLDIKKGWTKNQKTFRPQKREKKLKCEGGASLAFTDASCAYNVLSCIGTLSVGVEGLLGHNPAHLKHLQDLHGMGFQKNAPVSFVKRKISEKIRSE